ncbi:MAG: ADP-ribosylation factor-like protein [Candidatus Thorarchaeota archaeon]
MPAPLLGALVFQLIVPGTTVALTLVPGYVEIRDKGLVQKKVKTRNRSFDEVVEDVEAYFRSRGKILAPGLARETLVKIGLPQARLIVGPEDSESKVGAEVPVRPAVARTEVIERSVLTPSDQTVMAEMRSPELVSNSVAEAPSVDELLQARPVVATDRGGVLRESDLQDIHSALDAVERLSDSFMTASPESTQPPARPAIRLEGSEELVASSRTFATTVRPVATPTTSPTATASVPTESATITSIPHTESVSSVYVVKPLVKIKALLLGEDNVGKHTLLEKAGFVLSEGMPYVYNRVVELENHRVSMDVWLFDDAVRAKVTRKMFYGGPDVILVVYSASDRWSYESLDFWTKEVSVNVPSVPPIVIVGNKKDQREQVQESQMPPVSAEEGVAYAESLAAKLGIGDRVHPVAFVETSCTLGEGVMETFRVAADLSIRGK